MLKHWPVCLLIARSLYRFPLSPPCLDQSAAKPCQRDVKSPQGFKANQRIALENKLAHCFDPLFKDLPKRPLLFAVILFSSPSKDRQEGLTVNHVLCNDHARVGFLLTRHPDPTLNTTLDRFEDLEVEGLDALSAEGTGSRGGSVHVEVRTLEHNDAQLLEKLSILQLPRVSK